MFRFTQLIRNLYIRLEGWLYQFFGFLKKLVGRLNQFFSFLGKLLGFSNAQYSVETDDAQRLKQIQVDSELPAQAAVDLPFTDSATRRRPDSNMKNFLKMAQQVKNSKKGR